MISVPARLFRPLREVPLSGHAADVLPASAPVPAPSPVPAPPPPRTYAVDQLHGRQLNERLLRECTGPHEFRLYKALDHSVGEISQYICGLCQGVATGQAQLWYGRGVAAGLREAARRAREAARRAAAKDAGEAVGR